ncbi:hypothetical protein [Vibrio phage J14]|nr:hypothetical protein [Vibrio phage J14]
MMFGLSNLAYRKSISGSRSITVSESGNPAAVRLYITGIN